MQMNPIIVIILHLILISGVLCFFSEAIASEKSCSYEVAVWNVPAKKVIEVRSVRHPYSELTEEEIDPETGCTVCSEDQVTVSLPSLVGFRISQTVY